jgi:hypothetical protein
MSDNTAENKPTIQQRVEKMPDWLRTWYVITVEVLEVELAKGAPELDPIDRKPLAERLAFSLATREYKQRQANKKVYADAMQTIMEAADVFELKVGSNPEMALKVQPADGQGNVNITLSPVSE